MMKHQRQFRRESSKITELRSRAQETEQKHQREKRWEEKHHRQELNMEGTKTAVLGKENNRAK